MSEADITSIPKYFVVKVIFSQTRISRGSTETQSIGLQDVHNFINTELAMHFS